MKLRGRQSLVRVLDTRRGWHNYCELHESNARGGDRKINLITREHPSPGSCSAGKLGTWRVFFRGGPRYHVSVIYLLPTKALWWEANKVFFWFVFWNGNSREETKYDDGCDLVTVTGGEKAENYFTSTMFIHLIVDEGNKTWKKRIWVQL